MSEEQLATGRPPGPQESEQPADGPAPTTGDAVAGRDPDDIQREIERTRAELASAIDTIAERVSPKRIADRGKQAIRAKVPGGGPSSDGQSGRSPQPALPASGGTAGPERDGSALTLPGGLTVERRVAVLAAAGAAAVVAVVVGVVVRRRG